MSLNHLRQTIPALESGLIHFDNAGASLPSQSAIDAQEAYQRQDYLTGGYPNQFAHMEALEEGRAQLAQFLNVGSDHVAFTYSATQSWQSLYFGLPLPAGKLVVTNQSAYGSNALGFMHRKKTQGTDYHVLGNDPHGQLDLDELEQLLRAEKVSLVAIDHIPTNNGIVHPAEAVGRLCQQYGVLYLLDACQSAGQYPLDVEKLGCHMLTATGRKYMRGPRGTGFLYVHPDLLAGIAPPIFDLFSAEFTSQTDFLFLPTARRFEWFEANYGARMGLMAAIKLINETGQEAIWKKVATNGALMRSKLQAAGATVYDEGLVQGGIVTFTWPGADSQAVGHHLRQRRINVSVAPAAGAHWDYAARDLPQLVRASLHFFNTEEEMDQCLAALQEFTSAG